MVIMKTINHVSNHAIFVPQFCQAEFKIRFNKPVLKMITTNNRSSVVNKLKQVQSNRSNFVKSSSCTWHAIHHFTAIDWLQRSVTLCLHVNVNCFLVQKILSERVYYILNLSLEIIANKPMNRKQLKGKLDNKGSSLVTVSHVVHSNAEYLLKL